MRPKVRRAGQHQRLGEPDGFPLTAGTSFDSTGGSRRSRITTASPSASKRRTTARKAGRRLRFRRGRQCFHTASAPVSAFHPSWQGRLLGRIRTAQFRLCARARDAWVWIRLARYDLFAHGPGAPAPRVTPRIGEHRRDGRTRGIHRAGLVISVPDDAHPDPGCATRRIFVWEGSVGRVGRGWRCCGWGDSGFGVVAFVAGDEDSFEAGLLGATDVEAVPIIATRAPSGRPTAGRRDRRSGRSGLPATTAVRPRGRFDRGDG